MIEYVSDPGAPVVEIKVEGTVTDADLRGAIAKMREDIEVGGKTRVLERIEHFTGIEPAALWTDITKATPLAQKITHAAIVSDAAWIRGATHLGRFLTRAEVRTFRPEEIEAARAWLREA